jgi:hypothetical protein
MADDTRLDELLSSPLDQPDSFRVWWPLIAGVAVGVVGALGGYWLASSDPAAVDAATTVPSSSTTTTVLADDAANVAYPVGFIEVVDLVAVKPHTAVVYGDSVHIAVSTAVRRGFDATQTAPFNGGRWVLETAGGQIIESRGVVTTFNTPGTFSVVFPWEANDPPEPATLRLVEGLNIVGGQDEITIPYEGLPADAASIEAVELAGTTLVIESITVTEDEAVIDWSSSSGTPIAPSFTLSLVASNQNQVAVWYEPGNFFFGPLGEQSIPETTSGTVTLPRDRGLQSPDDVAAGTTLRLFTSANSVLSFPATAEFDVSQLPVITR